VVRVKNQRGVLHTSDLVWISADFTKAVHLWEIAGGTRRFRDASGSIAAYADILATGLAGTYVAQVTVDDE
jgi:hypothetical protein